jgi:hypothetical protein
MFCYYAVLVLICVFLRADSGPACDAVIGFNDPVEILDTQVELDQLLVQFRACLGSNIVGPIRCAMFMNSNGFPVNGYGNPVLHPPTIYVPPPDPLTGEALVPTDSPSRFIGERVVVSCDGASKRDVCGPGYVLRKDFRSTDSICFCERQHLEPFFSLHPCPDLSEMDSLDNSPQTLCPLEYHFEHRIISDIGTCFCVRNVIPLGLCPTNNVDSSKVCDTGFRFTKETSHGQSNCSCVRLGWEVHPCPRNGPHGELCPDGYEMKQEMVDKVRQCHCVDKCEFTTGFYFLLA